MLTVVAECIGVSRSFGSGRTAVLAIAGVDCQIASTARIALTGSSGSGKSTLLHLLAGVDTPTAGTVRWPQLPARPLRRPGGIGIVFQGPSLLPGFDVVENVALPMMLAGQDEDAANENARAALDLVGMSGAATKLPDELSGGQSQRVAIARVLVTRPALILADEPTGQLDRANADLVVTVLLSTAVSIGAALVLSTHDPAVATRLDDRWSMRDGRLTLPADSRAS
ncbi:MAG: lipoprotein-releasing system ATP-binding protein [Mycobacterium sp.]|nr:lipoprotein-releasing system ATP-binding protein [Mycobacterium sp.]